MPTRTSMAPQALLAYLQGNLFQLKLRSAVGLCVHPGSCARVEHSPVKCALLHLCGPVLLSPDCRPEGVLALGMLCNRGPVCAGVTRLGPCRGVSFQRRPLHLAFVQQLALGLPQ